MKVTIQYVHKTSPSFKDVAGPFDASPSDFETLDAARKWFKKHRITLGRVTFRKEGRRWVFFPASRMASSPHAIVVRPGTSLRLTGRELSEMSRRLKEKGYSQPGMYARKLYREGVRLDGRWTEEPGAEGHRAEGGHARSGRRYVDGVKERLYHPRGSSGSLEDTHGFRDPRSARRARRHRR